MLNKYIPLISFLLISCNSVIESEHKWLNLFDGSSTNGWVTLSGSELHSGWKIINNTLTLDKSGTDEDIKTDIIYGAEMFDNFELYLEWNIPPGGNSGIFYHFQQSGGGQPEYQIIDDENYDSIHGISLAPLQKTASLYGMYEADSKIKKLNPPGQWNTSRIIFTPKKVEHWLNGKKVLSFVPWSDDWYNRKDNGQWAEFKDFGESRTGYIGFQDYGNNLSFRNIKIKKLGVD